MLFWLTTWLANRSLERAESLRHERRWDIAQAAFEKAVRRSAAAAARGKVLARRILGRAYLGLGRICLQRNAAALAVERFEMACSAQPDAWEPFYYRGCGEGRLGNYDKAEASFTEALARQPADPRIHLQRGHARFKAGRLDEALADYLAAQHHGPLQGNDQLAFTALRMRRGEYGEAERTLRPLCARGSSQAQFWLGLALESQSKWLEAAAVYEQATRGGQNAAEVCARLGFVNIQSQRYDQAAMWFARARERHWETDATLFFHGWASCQLGQFDDCLKTWRLLKERCPRSVRLRALIQKVSYLRGCDLIRASDYAAAIPFWKEYHSGRERDEQLAQAMEELLLHAAAQAIKHMSSAAPDEAESHLAEACELAPADGRPLFYLALGAMSDRDFERGLALLDEAAALAPGDLRIGYYQALCLWWEDDEERAESMLYDVIARADSDHLLRRAAAALAALCIEQGRWSDAANVFLSVETTRDDLLAACLYHAGRLNELAGLTSGQAGVCYWQGLGYAREEMLEHAMTKLRESLKLAPDQRPAQHALSLLLKRNFLAHVEAEDWPSAATALAESRGAPGANAAWDSSLNGNASMVEMQALLLAGRRQEALGLLQMAFRENPSNIHLAHSLGLAALFTAQSPEADAGQDATSHAWRCAIAAWVVALSEESFWEEWVKRARQKYRDGVSADELAELREGIEAHLIKTLSTSAERNSNHSEGASLAAAQRFERLWQREVKAAATLQELGGFTQPNDSGGKLVCGPLAIELLSWQTEFGRFVAEQRAPADNGMSDFLRIIGQILGQPADMFGEEFLDPPKKQRLARCFSQLGVAQALLDLGRMEEALEALAEAACHSCLQTARRSQASRLSICADSCPRFDQFNPGYAGFKDKGRRLRADAIELAQEAHLALAQAAVTAAAPNLDEARAHWRSAIAVAQESGREASERTRRRISEMILGRAEALRKSKKLDAAIELLEQSQEICGGEELKGRLAECLTDRGVIAAKEEPPRWEASVKDLTRAVNLNPHAARSRSNLCVALNSWAGERFERGEEFEAIALLEEAGSRATDGLKLNQHNSQLRESLDEARSALCFVRNTRGVRFADQENWTAAISELEQALRLAPTDQTVRQNLQGVIGAYAGHLVVQGRPQRAREMLEQMLQRFTYDPALRAEVEKMQMMITLLGRRR